MKNEIEIKPCPFCGSEAEIQKRGSMRQSMIIGCTNCGCQLESGDVCGLTDPKAYAWNQRETNDELVKALELAERWLVNCMPTIKPTKDCPLPLPVIRAALAKTHTHPIPTQQKEER